MLAFAFNKQFFKGSSTEARISHVLKPDLFNYSASRVGRFIATESVLKASFSPAETLILPAFPSGFTQLCSSSYVSPSQLSNSLPAHSPSPPPPTAPGCGRPAPDSTHMEGGQPERCCIENSYRFSIFRHEEKNAQSAAV